MKAKTPSKSSLSKIVAITVGILFCVAIIPYDILRAYPSPEFMGDVHAISALSDVTEDWIEQGDFDGDGVLDELTIDYLHLEYFFAGSTSGLVKVHSGANGELLLARCVPSPFSIGRWCGDLDGNGTDDVLVNVGDQRLILGTK